MHFFYEKIVRKFLFLENFIEQQEKTHSENLKQREADKNWIAQKRQKIEQVQKEIETVFAKIAL